MVSAKVLALALVVLLIIVGAAAYSAGLSAAAPTKTTTSTLVRTFTQTSTQTIGSGATTLTTTLTMTASGPWDLLQYCFSPGGHCDQVLISWINRANSSIHVLVYSFTLNNVSAALIAAHNRGVDVRIVMEKDNVGGSGSEFYTLRNAGISIKWDLSTGVRCCGLRLNRFSIPHTQFSPGQIRAFLA
jgi:phosphatidylserine/phosphatidylglycerophosphate/cardiolipin synthase-like enzyme